MFKIIVISNERSEIGYNYDEDFYRGGSSDMIVSVNNAKIYQTKDTAEFIADMIGKELGVGCLVV